MNGLQTVIVERCGRSDNEPWYWVPCLVYPEDTAESATARDSYNLQESRLQATIDRGRLYLGFHARRALKDTGVRAIFQPDHLFRTNGWRSFALPEQRRCHEAEFPVLAYVIPQEVGEVLREDLGVYLPGW